MAASTPTLLAARERGDGAARAGGRALARRVGGADAFLERLELSRRLEGHAGCVNAVSFSWDGERLLSGSDDQLIKLW
jgi:WD40 repeat protein